MFASNYLCDWKYGIYWPNKEVKLPIVAFDP